MVFVWHSGEEAGLLGSHYNADFPVVPLDKVQAQFNIDMIGRNRDDNAAESSKVFVIGADRISTDLHNMVVDTNATFAKELDLDFEYNDPADPNSFYTRSDHYSYALEGHPDRVLLHRDAPGLPLRDRLGGPDSVPETGADRAARLPGRVQRRQQRQDARTRQQGPSERAWVSRADRQVSNEAMGQ